MNTVNSWSLYEQLLTRHEFHILTDQNHRTHAMPYYIYKIIPGETAMPGRLNSPGNTKTTGSKKRGQGMRTTQPRTPTYLQNHLRRQPARGGTAPARTPGKADTQGMEI
jgi:hypothetical protein